MNKDEARLESGVRRPRAKESNSSAALIFVIFGIDVEETRFTHASACGVLFDGGEVDNVQAIAVVGLVEEAIEDVLIVVDGAGFAGVIPSIYGLLKITNVEDMRGRQTLSHWANLGVTFVELVVHEQIFLVHLVVDDTEKECQHLAFHPSTGRYLPLVNVLSTREGCD